MARDFGSRSTYGYLRMRGQREDRGASLPSSGALCAGGVALADAGSVLADSRTVCGSGIVLEENRCD